MIQFIATNDHLTLEVFTPKVDMQWVRDNAKGMKLKITECKGKEMYFGTHENMFKFLVIIAGLYTIRLK